MATEQTPRLRTLGADRSVPAGHRRRPPHRAGRVLALWTTALTALLGECSGPPAKLPETATARISIRRLDLALTFLMSTGWVPPADDVLTFDRDAFARKYRAALHKSLRQGMPQRDARLRFAVLLAAMGPGWPRDPRAAMGVELLRSAVGDGALAIERLEVLVASQPAAELQRELLVELLQLYQVHREVAKGWPQFDRFEAEHLANATKLQVFTFHRHRAALLVQVGILDRAEASLSAATAALNDLSEREQTIERKLDLLAMQFDLLLAAERFDDADAKATELLGLAPAESAWSMRAMLARALVRIRTGQIEAAAAQLSVLATRDGTYAQRASVELALLHTRRGDLAAARAASQPFAQRELKLQSIVELVASARIGLLAKARGERPVPSLAELDVALEAELDKTLEQWRGVPPAATGIPFLFLAGRRDLLATLAALRLELHGNKQGAIESLQLLLRTETMGSTARMLAVTPPTLQTVRERLLPEGGLLLAWLPAPTQSFVFGLTATDCFALSLPSDAGLRSQVRTLRRLTGEPPTEGWERELGAAARPVVDWCLPPELKQHLDAHHHIAVVGRDLTGGIPFEALPYDAAGLELGAAKAIWSVPSMALMTHYAQLPARSRDHSVAVLAATDVPEDEQSLFGTKPIRPDPARWLSWSTDRSGRGLVLAPASATDLLLGNGANARLTVVVAHGIFDQRQLLPAGLQLGARRHERSGAVFADDIQDASDVLLLLVCNTASTSPRRGEDGGHHLGGALLRHGARVVVLADQQLEMESSMQWADHFVAAWRSGESAAEAAQLARAAVRKLRPAWRHPWFHASLRVEGLGHQTQGQSGALR